MPRNESPNSILKVYCGKKTFSLAAVCVIGLQVCSPAEVSCCVA